MAIATGDGVQPENVQHLSAQRARRFLRELQEKPFVAIVGGKVYTKDVPDEALSRMLAIALYEIDPDAFDP